MVVSRHEFLASLHTLLKPEFYLEIGVQYGSSLVLAEKAKWAVGIDPQPLISMAPVNQLPNQLIHAVTSDEYFAMVAGFSELLAPIDLAFIDGSHLMEDAMADYANVQRYMRPGGVIVFDDVLPYNEAIAAREQPPGGDWTGDVWKCFYLLLEMYESGLITTKPILVDTWPTGTMILDNVEPTLSLPDRFLNKKDLRETFEAAGPVPSPILNRTLAVHPTTVLEKIRGRLA